MDKILDYLKASFDKSACNLRPIAGGERSKAFEFKTKDDKYIYRINRQDIGFKKDKLAYDNWGDEIIIPEILKIDKITEGYGAISKFCLGNPINNKKAPLSDVTVASLLDTLETIKVAKIPEDGYGVANSDGVAEYKSWADWVSRPNTAVTKNDGSFYTWEEIKEIDFVDGMLVEKIKKEINELLPFVAGKRCPVHGDFGPGNIMINLGKVSGVIDWNEFGYGDDLYDLAYLDFWIDNTDFIQAYEKYCIAKGIKVANLFDRIRCNKLFVGLTALGIYGAIGWGEGYTKVVARIKEII